MQRIQRTSPHQSSQCKEYKGRALTSLLNAKNTKDETSPVFSMQRIQRTSPRQSSQCKEYKGRALTSLLNAKNTKDEPSPVFSMQRIQRTSPHQSSQCKEYKGRAYNLNNPYDFTSHTTLSARVAGDYRGFHNIFTWAMVVQLKDIKE